VLAQVGWERQRHNLPFETIYANLNEHVQISEAHVRYLYYHKYTKRTLKFADLPL